MTAKEFRNIWVKQNPNIVHIPSEHEIGLMEAYAAYSISSLTSKIEKIKAEFSDEWIEKEYEWSSIELKWMRDEILNRLK